MPFSVPEMRVLFFISLATVLAVAGAAVTTVALVLRRRYQQQMAADRMEAVGMATAKILHQLKNPLQTLMLHAELLRDEIPTELGPLRETSGVIMSEAERLAGMLDELGAWAAGSRRSLDRRPVRLDEMLEELAGRCPATASGRIPVRVESLAPATVLADTYYLPQAFENLIRNACEAVDDLPDGRVSIRVQEGKNSASVWIADNGPGMSPEQLERVFQPFVSTKGKGMGLGLPICREIIERHEGRIEATSTLGDGAVFRVILPLHTGSEALSSSTASSL